MTTSLPLSAYAAYISFFFFFNDTATTEIYTLSLHDALPISLRRAELLHRRGADDALRARGGCVLPARRDHRSEEHTSELQSPVHLVCRLLLEKKKNSPSCPATTSSRFPALPPSSTSVFSCSP